MTNPKWSDVEWWCETFKVGKYGNFSFIYCRDMETYRFVYMPVYSEKYPHLAFPLETAVNRINNWRKYVAPQYKLTGFSS